MCKKNREKQYIKNKYESFTKDEKQKQKYSKNMTDEQKQKYKDDKKQYRENKTDEQKQKNEKLSKRIQKKYDRRTKTKI